jgi:hypothetical protein
MVLFRTKLAILCCNGFVLAYDFQGDEVIVTALLGVLKE